MWSACERCEPARVGFVGDERDRAVVAAERGTGERQPARRVAEGLADRLAPALRVAAVVDLVEDDQGAAVLGADPVPGGVGGDLRVGDHDAVVLRRRSAPLELLNRGSSAMPTRAAAAAHWSLRCSVGTTTVIWSTVRSASSSAAIRRANVVLPAPGVATARKSRGLAPRYFTNARRCQPRKAWVSGAAYARTQGLLTDRGAVYYNGFRRRTSAARAAPRVERVSRGRSGERPCGLATPNCADAPRTDAAAVQEQTAEPCAISAARGCGPTTFRPLRRRSCRWR